MADKSILQGDSQPSPWERRLGFAIRLAGAVGIIFGLLGIILIPFISGRANTFARSTLTTASGGVRSMTKMIREVDNSLADAVLVLDGARLTLTSVASSVEGSKPLIRSTGELLGDRIPQIIDNTRQALVSAEEGAKAIDRVLRGLASLEPITGITYNPEKPLDKAISDVAISLEPLPGELVIVRDDLESATSDLDEVAESLEKASGDLGTFSDGLVGTEDKLAKLADDLDVIADQLTRAETQLSSLIVGALVTVELILLWFVFCQSAIFVVGSRLMRK